MNKCVHPSSNEYESVLGIKECFDKGYKLATFQSRDILSNTTESTRRMGCIYPDHLNVLIFTNDFIADMFLLFVIIITY